MSPKIRSRMDKKFQQTQQLLLDTGSLYSKSKDYHNTHHKDSKKNARKIHTTQRKCTILKCHTHTISREIQPTQYTN